MNDCAKNEAEAETFVIAKLSSCPPALTRAFLQGYQFLIQRMQQNARMRDEGTSRWWRRKTASWDASSNIWSSPASKKEADWHFVSSSQLTACVWQKTVCGSFPGSVPRAQKLPLKWCKWQICGLMGSPEEFPNQISWPSGVGYGSLTPIWNNLNFLSLWQEGRLVEEAESKTWKLHSCLRS